MEPEGNNINNSLNTPEVGPLTEPSVPEGKIVKPEAKPEKPESEPADKPKKHSNKTNALLAGITIAVIAIIVGVVCGILFGGNGLITGSAPSSSSSSTSTSNPATSQKDLTRRHDVNILANALLSYKLDNGSLPLPYHLR